MMKFLAPNIQEAIDSEKDLFGRDAFAAGLLQMLSLSEDPLVVALDEVWGAGKTVFAKRLQKKASSAGYPVVYFDAFAHDYEPDVFLALASAALTTLPKNAIQKKQLKEKAKSVGKVLGRAAIKGAVRAVSGGVLKVADFSEANEEIVRGVIESAESDFDEIIERRLTKYAEEQRTFSMFRDALSSLAATGDEDRDNRPVIFIVDELDRCRPNYALSVMETIKHLFSVRNVHFLIVCSVRQLEVAAKAMYGGELQADLYLEKFIHIRATFPSFEGNERKRLIKQFSLNVLKNMPDDQEGGRLKEGFAEFTANIATKHGYSLRRVERVCSLFGLCMAFTSGNTLRLPAILHILCDLKLASPDLFNKAKAGTIKYADVKKRYEFSEIPENGDGYLDWYATNWRYFTSTEEELKGMDTSGFRSALFNYNIRRENVVQVMANKIVDRFAFPE